MGNIKMSIPSLSNNMCGLFYSIKETAGLFYNDVIGSKIWVVLCNDHFLVYEGGINKNTVFDTSAPRDGVSVRKILCDDIDKIDENLSNQVEIQFDRVQLTLKDGELLNWAWV